MIRNLASLRFTPAQLDAIDRTLTVLEGQLDGLGDLSPQQRRSVKRMGGKSEAFCRRTLHILALNPQIVPPGLDLADAQGDLETLDHLRPRAMRLQRLAERATDTQTALGGDVMAAALMGYTMMKSVGRQLGLDQVSNELGERFSKTSRAAEAEAA
jgi:hypothetical protein